MNAPRVGFCDLKRVLPQSLASRISSTVLFQELSGELSHEVIVFHQQDSDAFAPWWNDLCLGFRFLKFVFYAGKVNLERGAAPGSL